ncbi:MAG: hypothetical protein ACK5XN_10680, partial [Bacteroidota bacterium]
ITKDEYYQRYWFTGEQEGGLSQTEAYHGSPYKFDKFTTEKIGTGEGAQAFGWGLYFTDLEGIARGYASAISASKTTGGRQEYYSEKEFDNYLSSLTNNENIKSWAKSLTKQKFAKLGDTDYYHILHKDAKGRTFVDVVRDLYNNQKVQSLSSKEFENLIGINKENFNSFAKNFERNLYKVSLHKGKQPSEYTWLEWDKDLSQSQVDKIKKALFEYEKPQGYSFRTNNTDSKYAVTYELINSNGDIVGKGLDRDEALKNAGFGTKFFGYSSIETRNKEFDKVFKRNSDGKYTTGGGFYNRLSSILGGDKQASLFLLENGIDGIKYPAESISRGATSDTARGFNYVVFDENAVTIEEAKMFQDRRGAWSKIAASAKRIISMYDKARLDTAVHEILGHDFLDEIISLSATNKEFEQDLNTIIDEYIKSSGNKTSKA